MSEVKEELLSKDLIRKAKRKEPISENGVTFGHNKIEKGNLTIRLADVWGFCYGVLYAIEAVGETLEKHSDQKIWVLGDLIHNPHVNNELKRRGATFIEFDEIDRIDEDDVVVVPAFGTKKEIFEYLDEKNLETIDTTCPEVREVEEKVVDFNEKDYTAIIHGKHEHQESIATSSFADQYLIVRDREETKYVCDYIVNGGDREQFLEKFEQACSEGFDPENDLETIGLANQTTMLMNESIEIFEMIEQAVEERDGHDNNVESIDTICSATQDRQDAVNGMVSDSPFDLFIVVGGHTSSNTKNLARTVKQSQDIPVYHVEDAGAITNAEITFLPTNSRSEIEGARDWLPDHEITLGLTAGASTPHSELEDVIKKLLSFY